MTLADKILSEFATPNLIVKRDFCFERISGVMLFNPDITDAFQIRQMLISMGEFNGNIGSVQEFCDSVLIDSEVKISGEAAAVAQGILSGDTAIFLEGFLDAVIISTRKWDKRAVAEPPTEAAINGPREGFTEDLKTNLSLIERRVHSQALGVEKMQIGRYSGTNVALVYISTIAKKDIIDKVRKRLKSIDIDAIVDSYYLEAYLDEKPYSIFRQCGITEKPDIVTAKLLEGRVAIVVDGSPMVLTLPFLFIEDFHSSEDYYQRSTYSSFVRLLRFAAILFAIYLPALYVAVQTHNYEIIPLRVLITLMDAVKGTPLKPLTEMLLVILLFEMIREASVRMPKPVGSAMSIVGALVLGETAVKAGLLSSPSILITALSSLALFLAPRQLSSMSLMRLAFTVVGGMLGIYGLLLCSLFVLHYLSAFDTYGTPYLAPFAPLVKNDLKDGLTLDVQLGRDKRPQSVPNINETRQA